jgi:site-specific recombinase
MDGQHDKSQRNLAILSYMGLACQFVGVVGAIIALVARSEAALAGVVVFVFGLALAGWAGNLSQIINLKRRVTDLEARESSRSDRQQP